MDIKIMEVKTTGGEGVKEVQDPGDESKDNGANECRVGRQLKDGVVEELKLLVHPVHQKNGGGEVEDAKQNV